MWPDPASNPGPMALESDMLPTAPQGLAWGEGVEEGHGIVFSAYCHWCQGQFLMFLKYLLTQWVNFHQMSPAWISLGQVILGSFTFCFQGHKRI